MKERSYPPKGIPPEKVMRATHNSNPAMPPLPLRTSPSIVSAFMSSDTVASVPPTLESNQHATLLWHAVATLSDGTLPALAAINAVNGFFSAVEPLASHRSRIVVYNTLPKSELALLVSAGFTLVHDDASSAPVTTV